MNTTLHVATNGRGGADGTANDPLASIQEAACRATPGDRIVVRAGVYRERVDPPHGGTDDERRITFETAGDGLVEIRGSEIITGWTRDGERVWRTEIPDAMFGVFHPFTTALAGDWFCGKGRTHHVGSVFVGDTWFNEAESLEEVRDAREPLPLWHATRSDHGTILRIQCDGLDPNRETVEVTVRQSVFYPSRTGVDFLTVRGFHMRHAATPWAPPTAEQIGLLGTNWSRGWIIEDNTISHSLACGITLGKYGDAFDNTSQNSAEGYNETIARALRNGWDRGTVGGHIVRRNTITDCEQAGIVGSLGSAFSRIEHNHIHRIWTKQRFCGAEIGGIKFHGAIDTVIAGNHVHHAERGIWLDWMSQGTRVHANLLHDNASDDLFLEVNHGPCVVDHNVFLSEVNLRDWSEGTAFVHNLFAGGITLSRESRRTPCHLPHSTAILRVPDFQHLDVRFFNNIFDGPWLSDLSESQWVAHGLWAYARPPRQLHAAGNVFFRAARGTGHARFGRDPGIRLEGTMLAIDLADLPVVETVTAGMLGTAAAADLPFEDAEGWPVAFGHDYVGDEHPVGHTLPGPFASPLSLPRDVNPC